MMRGRYLLDDAEAAAQEALGGASGGGGGAGAGAADAAVLGDATGLAGAAAHPLQRRGGKGMGRVRDPSGWGGPPNLPPPKKKGVGTQF